MKFAVRLVLSLPLWVAYEVLIAIPLWITGVIVIPLLALRQAYSLHKSRYFDRTVLNWNSGFARALFGNEEDGIDGLRGGDPAQAWWLDRTAKDSEGWRILKWSALRNATANLRFLPLLHPKIDPARIRYLGMDREPAKGEGGWYFCWQGPYSCVRYETKHWRFWWGWALKPSDRNGLAIDDPRAIRARMLLQLKKVA